MVDNRNNESMISLMTNANREEDQDGFFKLTDDEIDQIMVCCKPIASEITVQIDPSTFAGVQSEQTGKNNEAAAAYETSTTNGNSQQPFDEHFVCGIC